MSVPPETSPDRERIIQIVRCLDRIAPDSIAAVFGPPPSWVMLEPLAAAIREKRWDLLADAAKFTELDNSPERALELAKWGAYFLITGRHPDCGETGKLMTKRDIFKYFRERHPEIYKALPLPKAKPAYSKFWRDVKAQVAQGKGYAEPEVVALMDETIMMMNKFR